MVAHARGSVHGISKQAVEAAADAQHSTNHRPRVDSHLQMGVFALRLVGVTGDLGSTI